jgi:hypothetical protein
MTVGDFTFQARCAARAAPQVPVAAGHGRQLVGVKT